MLSTLCNGDLGAEVDILNGAKELGSLFHRALESLTSRDESGAAGTLVDDGGLDRVMEILGSGGASGVDETGAPHEAVDDLIAAEVDRMIGGQLRVDALVELSVARITCVQGLIATVVLGKLLFDDVGLDSNAEMICLTGKICREMVILVLLEGIVAEIAPENSRHAELVGMMECLGHLDDFMAGILAAEVDGGTDGRRTHVIGLIDRAKHDLAGDIWVGKELVVVHFDQEGNVVGVFARHGTEDAEGRGDGIAATLDGELHDVLWIKVDRVLGKARSRRVLDSLIDGQDREVAGIGQTSRAVQTLEIGKDAGIAIAADVNAVDEVGAWQMKEVLGDRLALVIEKGVGVRPEVVFNFVDHDQNTS